MKILILILSSFILFSDQIIAQSEWELKKEEDGIKAYTRSREGIKFNEYRVITEISASLSEVLAIFKDFDVHTELFPGTEEIKVYLDESERYVSYIKFDIPFPARDRDAVFNNDLSYDPLSKTLRIEIRCLTDEYKTDPDLVQMTFCEGFWEFKDLGNGQIEVVNQMIVDPAGYAPAFIVNSKTIDDPVKTLKSLRRMIKNDKYKGQSFSLLNK